MPMKTMAALTLVCALVACPAFAQKSSTGHSEQGRRGPEVQREAPARREADTRRDAPVAREAQAQPEARRAPETPAGTINRITLEQMQRILQGRGYRAEPVPDNPQPRLLTGMSGKTATVTLYSCDQGTCRSAQFRALFRPVDRVDMAFVNAWNREKRYVKAYLTPANELMLEMDVDLEGGVTIAHVSESFRTFEALLAMVDNFRPAEQQPSRTPPAQPNSPGQPGATPERRT